MRTFRHFIEESSPLNVSKLKHLSHIEDVIFESGNAGFLMSLKILNSIINEMIGIKANKIKIKIKYDGAPSVVAGINPENNKFFVGTKSVFNLKEPKINYTEKDIDQNYENSELNLKLKYCLKYLKNLGIKHILQGDLLYIDKDLKIQSISGNEYVIFRPNTITYAISTKSKHAKEILKSRIGIVFHTQYHGNSITNLKADFNVNTNMLNKTQTDVWFIDADFEQPDVKSDITEIDIEDFQQKLTNIKTLYNKIDKLFIDEISSIKYIKQLISKFTNLLIKLGESITPEQKYDKLIDFISRSYAEDIEYLKTDRGKQNKINEKNAVLTLLQNNKKEMITLYKLFDKITELKTRIMLKLEQIQILNTFVKNDQNEYDITSHEGFVVVTDFGVIKLINRKEFSKLNFQLEKEWTK